MAENSNIEWTDHTFNPWIGCTKVSPGCANCYAAAQDKFRSWTLEGWGAGKPRRRTGPGNWSKPAFWNQVAAMGNFRQCDGCGWRGDVRLIHPQELCPTPCCLGFTSEASTVRPRVFCASLADWLDDEVPIEWLADLLALIHATPRLDWLLLSKRPQNWRPRLCRALDHMLGAEEPYLACREWLNAWLMHRPTAPANVWLGTTVEDQTRADERIPMLCSIPARVRFLSCEPLLGPVELFDVDGSVAQAMTRLNPRELRFPADAIHWVIAGGESGSGAQPMDPDWARSLRDQCAVADVPFLFKQWGSHEPVIETPGGYLSYSPEEWARVERGEYIGKLAMYPANKKAAGRLLDGREHNEFPALTAPQPA